MKLIHLKFTMALVAIVLVASCFVRTVPASGPNQTQPPPPPPQEQGGTVVVPGHTAQPIEQAPPPPPPVPEGGIRGHITLNTGCTRMACQPGVCCNRCSLNVSVVPTEGQWTGQTVALRNHGCSADGCGRVVGCPLQQNDLVTFTQVDVRCRRGQCFGEIVQY